MLGSLGDSAEVPIWSVVLSGVIMGLMAIALVAFVVIQHQLKIENSKLGCEKSPLMGNWAMTEKIPRDVHDAASERELQTALKGALQQSTAVREVTVDRTTQGYRAVIVADRPFKSKNHAAAASSGPPAADMHIVMFQDNAAEKSSPPQYDTPKQPQQKQPEAKPVKKTDDPMVPVQINLTSFETIDDDFM